MSGTSPKHAKTPVRGFVKSAAGDLATRTNMTLLALLALAGVTGLLGGFDAAEPKGFFTAAAPVVGEEPVQMKVAPLDVEIRRTYVKDGIRVIEMRVTNTTPVALGPFDLLKIFKLRNSELPHDQRPEFLSKTFRITGNELPLDDFGEQIHSNPDVPLDIALAFYDPLDGSGPGQAAAADTLVLESYEFKKSILDGDTSWLPGDVVAEVSLK